MRKTLGLLCLMFAIHTISYATHGGNHNHHLYSSNLWQNNIPPRFQWDNNLGYCGEVCLISAGLYFGQYLSQYDMRSIAIDGAPESSNELLLGINDSYAASQAHLNSASYTNNKNDSQAFLAWVKKQVLQGYPVAIGVYTNEYLFYNNTHPNAGDKEYDHIVCVTGISSNHPLTDFSYYPDDMIHFSDNGLWGDPKNPPYHFSYSFESFQANRTQANAQNGPIYSLSNSTQNYAIAITAIKDLKHETVPVRVDTNVNYESPQIRDGCNNRPQAMPLTLTITISHLTPNVAYTLYRYNDISLVPDSDFNAYADNAYEIWPIKISSGTTYTLKENIMSDEIAIYRAVKTSN